MADINKTSAERNIVSAGSMGNASVEVAKFTSIGALVAGTDVFYCTKIPKGSIITDVMLDAEAGLSAATGTLDIGYVMGATTVADYFVNGFNTATGGKSPRNLGAPLECTDDCFIIATPLVANTVADKLMQVTTSYEYKGEL